MAPARMMQFADKHIVQCEVCRQDPGLAEEIEKIRDFVLPESKIPKSERDEEGATPEISPDEGEEVDADEEEEDEDFDNDFEEDNDL